VSPHRPVPTGLAAPAAGMRRWALLGMVVVVLAGLAVLDRGIARTAPAPAAVPLAAEAAPAPSESSSWYCAGGSGGGNGVPGATVYLTNTTRTPVAGTVTVGNESGTAATSRVEVPPGGQVAVVPGQLARGAWLAARVDLDRGGVVATQTMGPASAWAVAPCASTASPTWYFASGSTAPGSRLLLALFNPTTTPAVVDTTFATAGGKMSQPAPFEGVVVAPGQVVVADVGTYVQDEPLVATTVSARSGAVVADEVEARQGVVAGLSLRLGVPAPRPSWSLPGIEDPAAGSSSLAVLNPTSRAEEVQVDVQLETGPAAPFDQVVGPGDVWQLETSSARRIPAAQPFTVHVSTRGAGGGVVVDRVVSSTGSTGGANAGAGSAASAGAGAPGWGSVPAAAAVPGLLVWALPGPVGPGSSPPRLGLSSLGGPVSVRLLALAGRTRVTVATLRLPAHGFTVVLPQVLGRAGGRPLLVVGSGPIAAMLDEVPGSPGVVPLVAVPLAPPAGSP